MRRKANLYVSLLLCLTLLSSCTSSNADITSAASEQTVQVTSTQTEISEISEEILQTAEISLTNSEMESTTETTRKAATSDTEETAEITSETENAQTEASGNLMEISEIKTEITETAAIETTSAFVTTSKKPNAEVVIPKINMPQTGDKVISGDNAEADYSFASDGYISAMYSGSASAAKLRITCGEIRYDHDLTPGKLEFFPLMGSGSYDVKIYEQFSGNKFALIAEGTFEANISSSVSTYLYPNKYVDFDGNSACVKKAAEVCAGITDDVEKIAEIFNYVTGNISYDKNLAESVRAGNVTKYVPYPDNTLSKGTGICFDYTSLFAAMCRSQGIPARLVIGYASPEIYHAWNEVYTEETGWITPELFLKKKGYNIADATFYAGNSDKEKIAAYISDEGNYSALYKY